MKLRISPHAIWHRLQLILFSLSNRFAPRIHVIGDSHSSFCFTNLKPVARKLERSLFKYCSENTSSTKFPFLIHWLGPITMFRVGREGLSFINLQRLGVSENDVVVFVFGEIDARCHIEKQGELQNKTVEEIIELLVTNYLKAILDNKKLFSHLKCVVCSVVPPSDNQFNAKFPFYGTLQNRIEITKKLNQKIHQACLSHHLSYFDIYEDFSTAEGALKLEFSDGGVHIAQKYNHSLKQRLVKSQFLT